MTDGPTEEPEPAEEPTPPEGVMMIPFSPFGQMMSLEEMQELRDKQKMNAQANAHELRSFFKSLDKASLATLHDFLYSIATHGGKKMATHYAGITAGLLVAQGYCDYCGEDHDADLHAMLSEGGEDGAGPSTDD